MRPHPPTLSVVLPTLDEETRIGAAVAALRRTRGVDEIVVVDGASTDATVALARSAGATVLHGPRGRGLQLNLGAAHARGDALLFLHVDCRLPDDAVQRVHHTLAQPDVVAGAFRTKHVLDGPGQRWLRPVLPLADLRSRYTRHPYGDQALFVRADAFRAIGGYRAAPMMEDVDLARRLWRVGRIQLLPEQVKVSARRYASGPLRAAVMMNTVPMLWRLGVSERTLARWYGAPR